MEEVEDFHGNLIAHTGGSQGIRDRGLLESAIQQPLLQLGGIDLYPHIVAKASALGFFLTCNHPLVDGNKRIGLAAMQAVLRRNKFELNSSDDEFTEEILHVASGEVSLSEFSVWVRSHLVSFLGINAWKRRVN